MTSAGVPESETGTDDPKPATAVRTVASRLHRLGAGGGGEPAAQSLAEAERLLGFAARRSPGSALVEILERDQSHAAGSVLLVATDDMPFLVDSIGNALAAADWAVLSFAHPQVVVIRDAAGDLLDVLDLDADEPRPAEAIVESWMWVRMERNYAGGNVEDGSALIARLGKVLLDVRVSVRDWAAMRARAVALADELAVTPPTGLRAEDVDEGVALLRWLADDNVTFLGYREYDLRSVGGDDVLIPVDGTGLGILSPDAGMSLTETGTSRSFAALPPASRALARRPELFVLSKANSRSTVHRPVHLDYIGVKRFDSDGAVIGERRFLGQYSSSAYTQSVLDIPILRQKAARVQESLDLVAGSHDARDLLQFLQTYPRDELFQTHDDQLARVAASVLQLQERRTTRLYLRPDDYGRFMSCLVYLPRDRYTTPVRRKIEQLLMQTLGGQSLEYTVLVSESMLARLHYVIRVPKGQGLPDVDVAALEAAVAEATRSWEDGFAAALVDRVGDSAAVPLLQTYGNAFPEAYKADDGPTRGVHDALTIERLAPGELSLEVYEPASGGRRDVRLRITRIGPAMPLSRVLPILQSMGVEVVDEYPHEIARARHEPAWILDFGMLLPDGDLPARGSLAERFEEAFSAAWEGRTGVDGFNELIVRGGLRWRQVLLLRAYARYLRQTGSPFSQRFLEEVAIGNVEITRLLVSLFETRFAPAGPADRGERAEAIVARIHEALDSVASLDQDRILRGFLSLIEATLRTNYFQTDDDGVDRSSVCFKLDPRAIPDLPLPRPAYEIWVYAPRVEGVHLRFGSVARGGLRWSDRQEDFRTEVLGLVKAQEVKNAVIVPVGAKGGFYAKQLPDPAVDRDAWLAEGKAAYREFIMSLLDVTDNLVDGAVVPPVDVVRRDGDDPYLVVAADKGTATFSDIANGIAAEYGFWLGDAFASGGSVGYDHKGMGITARGAWESVKRHFRELGVDTQTQDFTVAGIGDMSGDVFGNGMLLSEHIRLVVAFDHRHVFVDPDPDAASSYRERRRLFDLPRSSWGDYDTSLISAGGGVFARSLKAIDVTPQMQQALGLPPETASLTPDALIRAALQAPVDLLWNGGIGTYVKAAAESNVDVGDKANDRIRIDGADLRVQVVGEGGNLGMTQLGRVEAALAGVRLNTDAIDNSAGVDTSDHEVNIKIALDLLVRQGKLDDAARVAMLMDMTQTVAAQVLQDNYGQNVVLGNSRAGAAALITVHQRMVRELERAGVLDRALESLPDEAGFRARRQAGEGLTGPELAVLLAYAKISLTGALGDVALGEDPYFRASLRRYFPPLLVGQVSADLDQHPLREQIVTTVVVNRLVNIAGITFVFRAMEETGASALEVVRAAWASIEIFGLDWVWDQINALDNQIPTAAQTALHLEARRLLDRSTRWFLQTRGGSLDVRREMERFGPVVAEHAARVPTYLLGKERERFERLADRFVGLGAPTELAERVASGLDVFALLDITDECLRSGESPNTVVPLYFATSERFDVDRTLVRITGLPRGDRWSALARQALRTDLYAAVIGLTAGILQATSPQLPPAERLASWEEAHAEGVARARATLEEIGAVEEPDLATVSVALRTMRNLVAQGVTTATG